GRGAHLGDSPPHLPALAALLRRSGGATARGDRAEAEPIAPAEADAPPASEAAAAHAHASPPRRREPAAQALAAAIAGEPAAQPVDRYAARELIRQARQWFEQHEPSSPIPILLRRAEHFVGKRYADVVQAIPAELLALWSADET
ncbi:type VI secretion system protein TssA, partial [Burkholderia pseudomallei]|nr:type VI secretion system protein TssA [Burkholderia pseudomallei]